MRRKRIIVIIILVGLLTAVGNLLMNVVSGGIVIPLPVAWPLLALAIFAGISLSVWQFLLEEPVDLATQNHTNRQRLLEKVKARWINGELENSLYGIPAIAVALRKQPDADENSWKSYSGQLSQLGGPLPPSSSIMEIYKNAGKELLILGEPGSGKTTLLLQLAHALLVQARENKELPIPVVFKLSSWPAKPQQQFKDWLAEELSNQHRVPLPLAKSWVATDKILPLLDGLDEVTYPSSLQECVKAINAYRQRDHGLVPIVVSCRETEYRALATPVSLQTEIVMQPLTWQQIDDWLASAGGRFATIRVALQNDLELQNLVKTPLMLSILPLAYEGISVNSLKTGSIEESRKRVFKQYTLRMLERHKSPRYKPEQTLRRLIWLADHLNQRKQTEFYLEHMQVDWLSTRWSKWLYHCLTLGPIGALVGLLIALLIGGLAISYNGLLTYGLIGLSTGILLSSRTRKLLPMEPISWTWRNLIKVKHLRNALGTGFVTGLVVGIINDLLKGIGAFATGIDVLEVGLIGALVGVLSFILLTYKRKIVIEPAERVIWSRPTFIALNPLRKGLDVGLVIGLANVLIFSQHSNLFSLLLHVLTYVLLGTLFSTLLIGLFTGYVRNIDKDTRIRPNEGMRRSVRNGVMVGLVAGLLLGLVSGLCLGLVSGIVRGWENVWAETVTFALLYSLTGGLLSGLLFGGDPYIRHSVLHILLWLTRSIPLNYIDFLNHATGCVLLRKKGGSYDFGHQLLLNYFASLDPKLTLKELAKQAQDASPTP